MNVLIVEDDISSASALQEHLQALGHHVTAVVSSGEEAQTAVDECRPDLVLMDILPLGAMDGIEAASTIRDRCDVPVVFLCASMDEMSLQRARDSKTDEYLVTPCDRETLSAILEVALRRQDGSDASIAAFLSPHHWLSQFLRDTRIGIERFDVLGLCTYGNAAAEYMYGCAPDALKGQSLHDLLHVDSQHASKTHEPADQTCEPCVRLKALGNGCLTDAGSVTRDGVTIEYAIDAIIDDERPAGFVVSLVDVSAREATARERHAREHQLAAIARLGQMALQDMEIQRLLDEAVDLVTETMQTDFAAILEATADGAALFLRSSGTSPQEGASVAASWDGGPAGYTMREGGSTICNDLHNETRFVVDPALLAIGATSCVIALIKSDNQRFGVLCAASRTARAFTENDVNVLESLANLLGMMIRRGHSQEEVKRQARMWALAARLHGILAEGRDLSSMLSDCLSEMSAAISSRRSQIWLMADGAPTLTLVAKAGEPDDRGGTVRLDSDGIVSRAARERRLCLQAAPASSVVEAAFPLLAGGRLLGVIMTTVDGDFSALQLKVFQVVASAIAAGAQRVDAERAMHKMTSEHAMVLDAAGDGIIGVDRGGLVTLANRAACQALGYTEGELLRSDAHALLHRACLPACPLLTSVRDGETGRVDADVLWCKSGTSLEVEYIVTPLQDEYEVVGSVIAFRDITERRNAENALRVSQMQLTQAQKMEALGVLSGGVAHDFNNMLTAIGGYAELMKMGLTEEHPHYEFVREILDATERAAALTRQLLLFSRRHVVEEKILDVNSVVTRVEKMLRRLIGEDVTLLVKLQPELALTRVDPGQLEQVVVNLAVNARDAMPQGGTLTIETSSLASAVPRGFVRLTVRDTGCGMDESVARHIFEPFFTTKEAGHGTGLGLSTVYGIVQKAGGAIRVDSKRGEGSCFTVDLPEVTECPAEEPVRPPRSSPSVGSETILLVEDEERVRTLIARILEKNGYRVLPAVDALDAVRVSDAFDGKVDLMLTDVVMPGGSGGELAKELLLARPELAVVYMSGYTDDATLRYGFSADKVHLSPSPSCPSRCSAKSAISWTCDNVPSACTSGEFSWRPRPVRGVPFACGGRGCSAYRLRVDQ